MQRTPTRARLFIAVIAAGGSTVAGYAMHEHQPFPSLAVPLLPGGGSFDLSPEAETARTERQHVGKSPRNSGGGCDIELA